MKNILKHLLAFHVSIAYLGMLTGFGMLLFTTVFIYLLSHDFGLASFAHWGLTYFMLIIGPGAILLAAIFYQKIQRSR